MSGDAKPGGKDSARDVLAAEEFGVPAPDPTLKHHGPVTLPEDPTGIPEPHDVLAAEEFAMPAPRYGGGEPYGVTRRSTPGSRGTVAAVGALALLALTLRARRKRVS